MGRPVIGELAAITTLLGPLGLPIFDTDATGATGYPRIVLWTSTGRMAGATLDDVRGDVEGMVGVKVTAATPAAVRIHAAAVRAALTPTGLRDLTVTGRRARLEHFDSRAVQVDRDVTIPGTNTHPAFADELFWLVSTPA